VVQQIGSYRVERLLGVGSFATVWLGYDASLGARVAIKVLAENWSHDLRVRERFLDEGRLLWRLGSDRVVRVHALGELPDGRPYLVMAWAQGGSLQQRLAAGPVPVREAVTLLREICAGVAVLHENGIVHRDLTPGNVLFSGEQVIIADLGLAKALAAASGLTARAGTPGYMAPEQDDPLALIDLRADVYGLGKLGVRLLGAPGGGLREGVPSPVAEVLRVATAQRPAHRYPDAAALATALDRATAGRARAGPVALAAGRTVMVLASVSALAAPASDAISSRIPERPGLAVDATGRIAVVLPAGWRADTGEWTSPADGGGQRGPALVISPDPAGWSRQAAVPGAFVWFSPDAAASTTPARFLADRSRAGCRAEAPRSGTFGDRQWLIAEYRSCPGGHPVLVEAVGTRPGGAELIFVQITPPATGTPAFADTLLAGVQVR
jgi:eukaryotic-like serine/threonine-protein kinase